MKSDNLHGQGGLVEHMVRRLQLGGGGPAHAGITLLSCRTQNAEARLTPIDQWQLPVLSA